LDQNVIDDSQLALASVQERHESIPGSDSERLICDE
jgi:hypothetical protein